MSYVVGQDRNMCQQAKQPLKELTCLAVEREAAEPAASDVLQDPPLMMTP
jgi:hypothetical protein